MFWQIRIMITLIVTIFWPSFFLSGPTVFPIFINLRQYSVDLFLKMFAKYLLLFLI